MAKNTIYDYSTTASSNSDISGIGTLGTNFVSNFDDAFRTIMAHIATDVSPRRMAIQGAIYGLTLANNAGDSVNDIDIAAGQATTDSTTDPRTMALSSSITKRLDANWVVGTNNGGLDTGAVADGTYHVWLIQRSDTGVVDALFSVSASSPIMPTSYDRKRRIGSIVRASASIRAFRQFEDRFLLATPISNRSSTAAATNIQLAVSVPSGLRYRPILELNMSMSASSAATNSVGDGDNATANLAVQQVNSSGSDIALVDCVYTDTSQNIRFNTSIGAGTISANTLQTYGWYDMRGRV